MTVQEAVGLQEGSAVRERTSTKLFVVTAREVYLDVDLHIDFTLSDSAELTIRRYASLEEIVQGYNVDIPVTIAKLSDADQDLLREVADLVNDPAIIMPGFQQYRIHGKIVKLSEQARKRLTAC